MNEDNEQDFQDEETTENDYEPDFEDDDCENPFG
jgi:hypothetical protein